MKTQDNYQNETVHLFLALRRKKENPELSSLCFREIIEHEETDLERLKLRCRTEGGIWRIHQTVNHRSISKATKILQHRLIDEPSITTKLVSFWKTCLLQKESKATKNFLLDVDSELAYIKTKEIIKNLDCTLYEVKTPNGYHIITKPFDTRLISNVEDVSVQKDGYVFLELYNTN